jgi:hypothetical protein
LWERVDELINTGLNAQTGSVHFIIIERVTRRGIAGGEHDAQLRRKLGITCNHLVKCLPTRDTLGTVFESGDDVYACHVSPPQFANC